jgi:hypothetical protein
VSTVLELLELSFFSLSTSMPPLLESLRVVCTGVAVESGCLQLNRIYYYVFCTAQCALWPVLVHT